MRLETKNGSVHKKADYLLIILALALVVFGVIMVYDASIVSAQREIGDKYFFLKNQLVWALLGIIAFSICARVDFHFWLKFTFPALLISLTLLLAVFIPGLGVKIYGANRWLNFGFFNIQPAEVTKLAFILYLSSIFAKKIRLTNFVFTTALILGIVLLQKDLGTATVIGLIGLSMYLVAGSPLRHMAVIIPVSLLALIFFIFSSNYRRERFASFLDPTHDPLGASYHINQVLIALGSGGFLGLGLGQSRQKYGFLPEVSTDSIFAVIGEELGFLGATFLVLLFLLLIIRCFLVAKRTGDKYGVLVASGIGSWLATQSFLNLASMTTLTPLTGVPLPFISYGGSSLVVTMAAIGMVFNISRNSKN